jgi:hypothetical protein
VLRFGEAAVGVEHVQRGGDAFLVLGTPETAHVRRQQKRERIEVGALTQLREERADRVVPRWLRIGGPQAAGNAEAEPVRVLTCGDVR